MLAGSLLGLAALLPQAESWRVAPSPAWLAEPLAPPEQADVEEPLRWLVVETQLDLRGEAHERYTRTVRAFVDEVDVRDGAQVAIDFDPDHEQVLLHVLALERATDGGTERIDQLAPERFSLLRREGGFEEQMLDGTHTLVAWLDDVRKGDRLELAYTVRGANPVFGGHAMDSFFLRWAVAIGRWRYRVLSSSERPLFHRGLGAGHEDLSEPVRSAHEGWSELVWEGADAPAVPVEDALPAGFDAWPWIQVTDFASWGDVARWAAPLYATSAPESPEALRGIASEIREGHASPAERVLAALRWAQDEVRYLGIELGPRSHRPSPPELVLQRRFGDCKDKSLLLARVLGELGIEAVPALVSAGRLGRVEELLPSILAFDHVVVRARVEGRDLWLDPTLMHQRPELEALERAPFGRALPIEPDREDLVAVPAPTAAAPEETIFVRIDTRLYPGIEQDEPPSVEEDDAGRIEVRESYRVPEFWSERDGVRRATLEPLELSSRLIEPVVRVRHGPIGLAHPTHLRYELEVLGTHPWRITPAKELVDGPGVSLSSELSAKGKTLRLEWIYRTRSSEVPSDQVGEYVDWLERAKEELAWTLTPPDTTVAQEDPGHVVAWLVVFGFVGVLVLSVGLGIVLWVANPGAAPPAEPVDGPVGLGGWCVLLGLRTVFTPIGGLVTVVRLAVALVRSGASSDPTTLALAVDGALWSFATGVGVVLAVAFFARKRFFRPAYIGLSFVLAAGSLLDLAYLASRAELDGAYEVMTSAIWTVILALYAVKSRRVRNTFVR